MTQNDISAWLNTKPIDVLIAASVPEYEALTGEGSTYRLTSKEVTLAGFPRHDRLVEIASRQVEPPSTILVMPTWRQSLLGSLKPGSSERSLIQGFPDSAFGRAWSALLGSSQLADLARSRNLEVVFIPHPNLAPYLQDFGLTPSIRVASYATEDVQKLLTGAGVVVTDYSSVAFDAALIGRPVVYYQFDRPDMFGGGHLTRPGYFSYRDDGFGPVVETLDDALDAIESALAAGGPPGIYEERVAKALPYRNGGNCARVVDAIQASVEPHPAHVKLGVVGVNRAPFFSVIMPIHNTRDYLPESIGSVLGQAMGDLELILVDDGSTDGSLEVISAYADPRIHVVALSEQAGPGEARNAGLDQSCGQYVLFLDSDDAFTAGALGHVRDRIASARDPDIVVFDHLLWFGGESFSAPPGAQPSDVVSGCGTFTLQEHRELLRVFNAPWSWACRRDLILRRSLRFPAGIYEDVPWTMCGLMAAESIAGLHHPVVMYRQRTVGSILRSPGRRHFDVFSQWQLVFGQVHDHPAWEVFRAELFDFMILQFDSMLMNPTRVPEEFRRDFFSLSTVTCQRFRPAGWLPHHGGPLRGTRLRHGAILRGNYRLYWVIAGNKPRVDSVKRWVFRFSGARSADRDAAGEGAS